MPSPTVWVERFLLFLWEALVDHGAFSSAPGARCPAQLRRGSPALGTFLIGREVSFPTVLKVGMCTHSSHSWVKFPLRMVNRLRSCWSTQFLLIQHMAKLFLFYFAHTVIKQSLVGLAWLPGGLDSAFQCRGHRFKTGLGNYRSLVGNYDFSPMCCKVQPKFFK